MALALAARHVHKVSTRVHLETEIVTIVCRVTQASPPQVLETALRVKPLRVRCVPQDTQVRQQVLVRHVQLVNTRPQLVTAPIMLCA